MRPGHWSVILLVLSLAAAPVATAKIYKWVDEQGVTHYSQTPPPQGAGTIIEPQTHPPEPPEDSRADGQADSDAITMTEFCRKLRQQKKLLTSNRPIRVKNEDGTLSPLKGEARARRLKQVRAQLDKHCAGTAAGS